MIKVLPCRFQQCLGAFIMLLAEVSSEIGLFRHFSKRLWQFVISEIQKLWGLSFFQNVQYLISISRIPKKLTFFFCFLGNCIWIGCVKLSLLRREFLSFVVNALNNRTKILHIIKRDFFRSNFLHSDQ